MCLRRTRKKIANIVRSKSWFDDRFGKDHEALIGEIFDQDLEKGKA